MVPVVQGGTAKGVENVKALASAFNLVRKIFNYMLLSLEQNSRRILILIVFSRCHFGVR